MSGWITGLIAPPRNVFSIWKIFDTNLITGKMNLHQDFKEFIELLNKNNVKYMVIGGYAMALHGLPRYTKDIDIWVKSESKMQKIF